MNTRFCWCALMKRLEVPHRCGCNFVCIEGFELRELSQNAQEVIECIEGRVFPWCEHARGLHELQTPQSRVRAFEVDVERSCVELGEPRDRESAKASIRAYIDEVYGREK